MYPFFAFFLVTGLMGCHMVLSLLSTFLLKAKTETSAVDAKYPSMLGGLVYNVR